MERLDDEYPWPESISDYFLYNKNGEPVLFSNLPLEWNESESSNDDMSQVYTCGNINDTESCFHVKAWRYDEFPEISVLLTDNDDKHWIKLEKPSKSYEEFSRSIIISLHCLSFFSKEPEASWNSFVSHLMKECRSFDIMYLEDDLMKHIKFIREATERDEMLKKSKFLALFLEKFRKRNSIDEEINTKVEAEPIRYLIPELFKVVTEKLLEQKQLVQQQEQRLQDVAQKLMDAHKQMQQQHKQMQQLRTTRMMLYNLVSLLREQGDDVEPRLRMHRDQHQQQMKQYESLRLELQEQMKEMLQELQTIVLD